MSAEPRFATADAPGRASFVDEVAEVARDLGFAPLDLRMQKFDRPVDELLGVGWLEGLSLAG